MTLPAYLAALHHTWLVEAPDRRWRDDPGSLVFFDISGFTPLTERLASRGKIGAEELTDVLGAVFGQLLGAADRFGGDTLKFGGDAVLLGFLGDEHEARACAAAWAMQQVMRGTRRLKTSIGTVALRASCGVASGPIHAFLAGSVFDELVVGGPTTTSALTMEAAAHAGEILVAPSTAAALPVGVLGSPAGAGGRPLLGAPPASETALQRPLAEPERPGLQPSLAPYLLHGAEGEHRQAAVAFLQYRGLDEFLAAHGPDSTATALGELLSTVQDVCVRREVTIIGTDCDRGSGKVVLAAGAPAAGDDDEDRLLLAVRDVLREPHRLSVRAGANRGRVFAVHFGSERRRTWTTMGETTNLAARVMGRAGDGELVATSALMRRARAPFHAVELDPFEVKGVAVPVQASVVGDVGDPGTTRSLARSTTHAARTQATPFVGRAHELGELERLVRESSGAIVELLGEPGIGKTRLLNEVAERARRMGRTVVVVEGRPYGTDTAYGAVRSPLRELLVGPGAPDDQVALALREHLPESARRWMSLVGIPFGLELPPTAEQRALTPSAARTRLRIELLPVLAELVPDGSLLAIENAHWLDEPSGALLSAILGIASGRQMTTVIATRDPVPELRPDGLRTMELGPLDADAVDALLLHDGERAQPLPPAVAQAVAARSHGHPLFLEELINAAHEGHDIDALPDSVEALLGAHIDRLAPGDRAVLRDASVLGMAFSNELLSELSGLDAPDTQATLRRLGDFLDRQADGTWAFRQALARETAYEALPFRARRRLHGRAAELMERAAADDPGPASPILSMHADVAGDHARSWRFSRMAADRAQVQGAPVEASVFLRRALRAGRQIPDLTATTVGEVAQRLGDVCELAGLYDQADEAYRDARRLMADVPARAAELCRRQGWLRERTGNYSQALRWYTRGLSALGDTGGMTGTRLRGRLTLAYGAARLRQGRLVDSIDPLLEAARLAERTDDRPSLAHASYLLDWAHTDLGRPVQAYRDQALQIYEDLGDWTGQANVLNNLGVDAYFAGDWTAAMELYERSRLARERGGDVVRFGEALHNVGELLVDQGRLDDAEPRLRRALGLWRGAGFPVGIGVALMNLGRAAARRGDDERAAEFLARARETLEGIGSEQTVDVAIREGERQVLRGRGASALRGLEAARHEAVRRGGAPVLLAQIDRLRAGATAQEGDLPAALGLLDDALESAHGTPYEEALVVDLQDRLAPLTGGEVAIDPAAVAHAHEVLRGLGVVRIWPPPVEGAPHDDTGVAIAAGAGHGTVTSDAGDADSGSSEPKDPS